MQMIDSMLIVLQLERKKSTVKAEAQMWCDISVMSCVWSLAQCLWSEGQEVITKNGTTPRPFERKADDILEVDKL